MHGALIHLSFTAVLSWAASSPPSCSTGQLCPHEYPCCSGGTCGTGTYCLGGCDPLTSYSLDACTPKAVAENQTFSWPNLHQAVLNTKYLGDANTSDWEYSGSPKLDEGNVVLTMPKDSVGTLLSSTHYIWYGKTAADIKSSRGKGVVTGFILMSDVKDEIDFEWVGADLENVQSNFYFQGVTNYTNGDKHPVGGRDTYGNWHRYEIDWTPEAIRWSVDGNLVRTLNKKGTWNTTGNRYEYPQTPCRMQLSLWPAGRASNAQGTIDWAGGQIDWNSAEIRDNGYYSASFANISMQNYDSHSRSGDELQSYVYVDKEGMESSVRITNNKTVLPDMGHAGLNMASVGHSLNGSSTGERTMGTMTSDKDGFTQSTKNGSSGCIHPSLSLAALVIFMSIILP